MSFTPSTAVTCLGVGLLTDASIEYDSDAVSENVYPFGTVATFSCEDGFDLVGPPMSTCEGLDVPTGEFTPNPLQCLGNKLQIRSCMVFEYTWSTKRSLLSNRIHI